MKIVDNQNKQSPLVSVCLPVFNGEQFLAQAIESVLSQTYNNFELLISDDCSTDSSSDIINHYKLKDARIQAWRNDETLGLFANYNLCMRRAKGQYIKPFAQDDLLEPEILRFCLQILNDYPSIALVSCARSVIDAEGDISFEETEAIIEQRSRDLQVTMTADELFLASLFPMTNFVGEPSTVMFRAEAIGDGFDENLHHLGDLEYWLRIVNTNGSYHFVAKALCKFRTHQNSASSYNLLGMHTALDLLQISKKFSETLRRLGSSEREFIELNLKAFANNVSQQSSKRKINSEKLFAFDEQLLDTIEAQSQSKNSSRKQKQALADLLSLQEITFRLCNMFNQKYEDEISSQKSEDSESDAQITRTESLIKKREKQLESLLRSKSWAVTKPLRDLNKIMASIREENVDTAEMDDKKETSNMLTAKQIVYLQYLRRQIRALKSSTSWVLTKPLRYLEK